VRLHPFRVLRLTVRSPEAGPGSEVHAPGYRMGTAAGRWVIAASVLGSGIAFIDGTVVNAALPAIARELDADLADLQWIVTGYLLSLSSLLVIGGSLGDRYGRRWAFVAGLGGFAVASAVCTVAPGVGLLVAARVAQGAAAALLIPSSLALISATFAPGDRAPAIGAWSGLGGIAGAIGPFLGGWLIESFSWRAVFLINLPLCVVAAVIALRHVPETRDAAPGRVDALGGATLAAGLAGLVFALIEGPARAWPPVTVVAGVAGALLLVAFAIVERRVIDPMVPLPLFADRQFSGANVTTVFLYAALGVVTFLVVVHLQANLGYSPLEAGAALLPMTVLLLLFSARSGALAQRIGPRLPMTVGPLLAAVGVALFARVEPGTTYLGTVLPAAVVLGAGLVFTVAPLTAAVLAAVPDDRAGIGSALNNAVARLGGLLAVAVLPAAAGLTEGAGLVDLRDGFARAMVLTAALPVLGAVASVLTIQRAEPVEPMVHGPASHACLPACVAEEEASAGGSVA
jgi:EmrB/QacA subfamily drug resistance transporter